MFDGVVGEPYLRSGAAQSWDLADGSSIGLACQSPCSIMLWCGFCDAYILSLGLPASQVMLVKLLRLTACAHIQLQNVFMLACRWCLPSACVQSELKVRGVQPGRTSIGKLHVRHGHGYHHDDSVNLVGVWGSRLTRACRDRLVTASSSKMV